MTKQYYINNYISLIANLWIIINHIYKQSHIIDFLLLNYKYDIIVFLGI